MRWNIATCRPIKNTAPAIFVARHNLVLRASFPGRCSSLKKPWERKWQFRYYIEDSTTTSHTRQSAPILRKSSNLLIQWWTHVHIRRGVIRAVPTAHSLTCPPESGPGITTRASFPFRRTIFYEFILWTINIYIYLYHLYLYNFQRASKKYGEETEGQKDYR